MLYIQREANLGRAITPSMPKTDEEVLQDNIIGNSLDF